MPVSDLEQWLQRFDEIGVSSALLVKSLPTNGDIDLVGLYTACLKLCRPKIEIYGSHDIWPSRRTRIVNEWQLVALQGDIERLKEMYHSGKITEKLPKDNRKACPAHYIALSGNVSALQAALEIYNINSIEISFHQISDLKLLSYAALSGSVDMVKYVLSIGRGKIYPSKQYSDCAMASGNLSVIECIPEHMKLLNKVVAGFDGFNRILAAAVSTGSISQLDYALGFSERLTVSPLKKIDPNFLDEKLLLSAALSGSVAMLKHVLTRTKFVDCSDGCYSVSLKDFQPTGPQNLNMAHYAAYSGSVEMYQFVEESCDGLFPSLYDESNRTVLHCAGVSGSIPMLEYLIENTNLLSEKDANGYNVLHYVAHGYSELALRYLLQEYVHLVTMPDNRYSNILHYAAANQLEHVIQILIRHFPKLAAELWQPSSSGETPDSLASNAKMNPNPKVLLTRALAAATKTAISDPNWQMSANLINAFSSTWQQVIYLDDSLLNSTDEIAALKNNKHLNRICRHHLQALSSVQSLCRLDTTDQCISFSLLEDLLDRAQAVHDHLNCHTGLFRKRQYSKLYNTLKEFLVIAKIKEPSRLELSADAILALLSIVDCHQRHGNRNDVYDVDRIVLMKLSLTSSVKQFVDDGKRSPMPRLTTDNCAAPYEEMLAAHKRLQESPSYVKNPIVSGTLYYIGYLSKNIDTVVGLTLSMYAPFYFGLESNVNSLCLQKRHVNYPDASSYRNELLALLTDLFSAFRYSMHLGFQNVFFQQLTVGDSLEDRILNAVAWTAQYNNLKSFEEVISAGVKKYIAYRRYVFDESESDASYVKPAREYIMHAYAHTACIPHATYAPNGKLTKAGVEAYLDAVLDYRIGEPPIANIEQTGFCRPRQKYH